MRIDDDSWFKNSINWDLFDILENYPFATAYTWNHVAQRHHDTREQLWEFFKDYLLRYGYTPRDDQLKQAIEADDENLMHCLRWSAGNLNLYDMKAFRVTEWREYQNELRKYCGDYKYRWNDIETIGLFAYTHFDTGVFDLRLRSSGMYSERLPEAIGNYAPSVDAGVSELGNVLSRYRIVGICFAVVHVMRRRLPSWIVKLRACIALVLERQKNVSLMVFLWNHSR